MTNKGSSERLQLFGVFAPSVPPYSFLLLENLCKLGQSQSAGKLLKIVKGGGTDSHDGCVLTHRGMDLLEDTV
ncbi:hypothetical protein ACVRXQ_02165 [Streptococcus panodentis]|uniref:Uncharacterized protein n=1 Tax=Streptococcus panodentis TaxID=1581472 RepID=A0ABS5AW70_9STRE|nr:hypothetical protein [Streptococcus panodentis]MBP2619984.1 hypothetical protein [Streptococcus panodentis]